MKFIIFHHPKYSPEQPMHILSGAFIYNVVLRFHSINDENLVLKYRIKKIKSPVFRLNQVSSHYIEFPFF